MVALEPISLSLGAASLALQVLQGCKKGYDFFMIAVRMPEDCTSFKIRLMIEHTRLLDWADLVGLADAKQHGVFDIRYKASRTLIFAILTEINTLLQNLQMDYKNLKWDETKNQAEGTGFLVRDPEFFKDVPSTEDLKSFGAAFQTQNVPQVKRKQMSGFQYVLGLLKRLDHIPDQKRKRLRWAIVDRDRFIHALSRLKDLTDYLHQTTGDANEEFLKRTTQETCLAVLKLTNSVEEMRELLKAAQLVKILEQNEVDSESDTSSRAMTLVDADDSRISDWQSNTLFDRITSFSIVHLEIASSSQARRLSRLALGNNPDFSIKLEGETDYSSRSQATYQNKRFWVEWKSYEEVPTLNETGDATYGPEPETLRRVERLVELLNRKDKPSEFRVPDCLGYFLNKVKTAKGSFTQFGLLFDFPGHTRRDVDPTSLYQLLHRDTVQLHERVNFAKGIATSLFALHAAGWLHKDLRSANVLFFHCDQGIDISHPYISGFEYTRPDTSNLTTKSPPESLESAPYRHPRYQGRKREGFRKTFDMYSLGIILLEIAHWTPAERLFSLSTSPKGPKDILLSPNAPIISRVSPEETDDIRERLLMENSPLMKKVHETMGPRYHDVVKACIQGLTYFGLPSDAEETGPHTSAMLQQGYLRLVVDVLESIVV